MTCLENELKKKKKMVYNCQLVDDIFFVCDIIMYEIDVELLFWF